MSIGAVVGVFALLVGGFAAYALVHLNANLKTEEDYESKLGSSRPADTVPSASGDGKTSSRKPLNIVLIGSDQRDGENDFVGGESPGLSDTTIVLHLSADRSWATAVSIPRDSMVEMPQCVRDDGSMTDEGILQFNEAYTVGGPACVVKTIESLTDLRIHHFVVVDFAGFRTMVNALDGVKVCIPEDIDDGRNITFSAGEQTLDGDEALDYVRVRHIGTGDDRDRIKRQQAFLSSMIRKVTEKGTLLNPIKLYPFLDAATSSVTVDPGLGSVNKLAGFARQVNKIGLDQIEFTQVPTEAYTPVYGRLQWADDADALWEYLRNDEPLPGSKAAERIEASPSPTVTPTPTPAVTSSPEPSLRTPPENIFVHVLNATGTPGDGTAAAEELKALGYQVVGIDTADEVLDTTVVKWSQPRDESSKTLAAAVDAPLQEVEGLGQVVELYVGLDYAGAHEVEVAEGGATATPTPTPTPTPSATPTFETRTADDDICV